MNSTRELGLGPADIPGPLYPGQKRKLVKTQVLKKKKRKK